MSQGEQPLLEPVLFEPLTALVKTYGIVNLVETGTGPSSSGMEAARRLRLRGYTCDVFAGCVQRVRRDYPEFESYHSESLTFLTDLLPRLHGPTFFWLDGHCPTDTRCLPGPIFPPYEEMLLIKHLKAGYAHDVLWLDDIAMIDVPDNPVHSSWDVDLAGRRWFGAKEHTWEQYTSLLADTHDGVIVDCMYCLTPKAVP